LQENDSRDIGQVGETKPASSVMIEFSEPEIREFKVDLEWSESMEQWAFYLLCLSRFFPNIGADWARIKDILQQRQGGDIQLAGVGQIKARRAFYGDQLIEYAHVFHDGRITEGWATKPQNTDWLMYCTPARFSNKLSQATLYDWLVLQTLCIENEAEWLEKYKLPPSPNPTYDMLNAGIPFELLEEAIMDKLDLKA